MDIENLRREFNPGELHRRDLKDNPVAQFELWFKQACDAEILDPNAMSLATVSADGYPNSRMVLLKYFDSSGFVFFTNLESNKAEHIAKNPHVSLLFPWLELARQVIVTGCAKQISSKEALRYFAKRPRSSQLGAWVSKQSSVISSRNILEIKFEEMKRKFAKGRVPIPSFWGGYRVEPSRVEFWQGQPYRLHDRFLYVRQHDKSWRIERLAP